MHRVDLVHLRLIFYFDVPDRLHFLRHYLQHASFHDHRQNHTKSDMHGHKKYVIKLHLWS